MANGNQPKAKTESLTNSPKQDKLITPTTENNLQPNERNMITMAIKTTTEVLDDMTGETGAETVSFAVNGVSFEIDLADKNRLKFEKAMAPFVEAAREVVVEEVKKTASKNPEVAKIREWAKSAGVEVNARGRISKEVQEAYRASTSVKA